MVVIFLPATAATGVTQERSGAPSTCTVQAPHCAMPQPNLVPVSAHQVAQDPQQGHVGRRVDFALGAVDVQFHGSSLAAAGVPPPYSRRCGLPTASGLVHRLMPMSSYRRILETSAAAHQRGDSAALAVVVETEGSTYVGPGAMALFGAREGQVGWLSGGCLEPEIERRAHDAAAQSRIEWMDIDTRDDEDLIGGSALGCRGRLRLALLPLAALRGWPALVEAWRQGQGTLRLSVSSRRRSLGRSRRAETAMADGRRAFGRVPCVGGKMEPDGFRAAAVLRVRRGPGNADLAAAVAQPGLDDDAGGAPRALADRSAAMPMR